MAALDLRSFDADTFVPDAVRTRMHDGAVRPAGPVGPGDAPLGIPGSPAEGGASAP